MWISYWGLASLALALVGALAGLAYLLVALRKAEADADFALAIVDQVRRDLSAAEARARGVGGRGEHAGVVVNPAGRLSRRMREATRLAVEVKGKGNG